MTPMAGKADIPSAFWQFSLSLYGRPGVPDLCIALQDTHKIDVNVLFYLLFRAEQAEGFGVSTIANLDAGIKGWRDEVVRPLRAVRRVLKTDALARLANDDDALRQTIKAAELRAEKLQQYAIERMGQTLGTTQHPTPTAAASASWQAYGAYLNTSLSNGALTKLVDACLTTWKGN